MSVAAALPADLLEQARQLSARARRWVTGSVVGGHRSRQLGGGSEFSEHKAYASGDDLRHVDWKVAGRTDRLVVKRFESDRQAEVQLVVDRSGSMGFGSTGGLNAAGLELPASKWDMARLTALTLAHAFLRQGDRVGVVVVGNDGATAIPARGGERQLLELAQALVAQEPAGRADLSTALGELLSRRRRCIAVLVSDCLDEGDWLTALRVHAARGRDAWVLHVVDPAERDLPGDEPAFFVDLEGAGELGLDPKALRAEYQAVFGAFLVGTAKTCLDSGVRHMQIDPADGPIEPLRRFLRPGR